MGSLTGAVSSIVGPSDGNVRVLNLAICWDIRPLLVAHSVTCNDEGVKRPALPIWVKMRPARTISREVFVTPQRLHAEHPLWMVIQSELSGDRELNLSASG